LLFVVFCCQANLNNTTLIEDPSAFYGVTYQYVHRLSIPFTEALVFFLFYEMTNSTYNARLNWQFP